MKRKIVNRGGGKRTKRTGDMGRMIKLGFVGERRETKKATKTRKT